MRQVSEPTNDMSESKKNSGGGVGFVGLLTIVFITLKLCHVIDWSWWLVLLPILICVGIVASILIFFAIGYWITKPRTPQEKVVAACYELSERIRRER